MHYFLGNGQNSPESLPVFNATSPGKSIENIHRSFLEGGKVTKGFHDTVAKSILRCEKYRCWASKLPSRYPLHLHMSRDLFHMWRFLTPCPHTSCTTPSAAHSSSTFNITSPKCLFYSLSVIWLLNQRGKNLCHSDVEGFKRTEVRNWIPSSLGKNGPNSEERGIYTNPSYTLCGCGPSSPLMALEPNQMLVDCLSTWGCSLRKVPGVTGSIRAPSCEVWQSLRCPNRFAKSQRFSEKN